MKKLLILSVAIALACLCCVDKTPNPALLKSLDGPFRYAYDYGAFFPKNSSQTPVFKDGKTKDSYLRYAGEYVEKLPTKEDIVNNLFRLKVRQFDWGNSYSCNKYLESISYEPEQGKFAVTSGGGVDYLDDVSNQYSGFRVSGPGISTKFYTDIIAQKQSEQTAAKSVKFSQTQENEIKAFLKKLISEILRDNLAALPQFVSASQGIELREYYQLTSPQIFNKAQIESGLSQKDSIIYAYFHTQSFLMKQYENDPVELYINTYFSCDRVELTAKFPDSVLIELHGGPYNFQHLIISKENGEYKLVSWYTYFDGE